MNKDEKIINDIKNDAKLYLALIENATKVETLKPIITWLVTNQEIVLTQAYEQGKEIDNLIARLSTLKEQLESWKN